MRIFTVYEAEDGTRFNSLAEAIKWEFFLDQIHLALAPLGKRPTDSDFANGGGYIQHEHADVMAAKASLVANYNLRSTDQITVDANSGWICRLLDGSCPPLESAFGRLSCIDYEDKEWGQPFFGLNPSEGKPIQLTKVPA